MLPLGALLSLGQAHPRRSRELERSHAEFSPLGSAGPTLQWPWLGLGHQAGRCARQSTCGMNWKRRRSSFLQGMFSSAKHNALGLVKVRRLWLCLLQLCVFLISVEGKWYYVF